MGNYPRWRCGEPGCEFHRRSQPVDQWGEYDDVDVALAELERHYRRAHGDREVTRGRLVIAA